MLETFLTYFLDLVILLTQKSLGNLAVKQRYPSNSLNNGPTDLRLRLWTRPFFDVGNLFDLLFGLGDTFDSEIP